ncbi:MAG: hypothetical protein GY909_09635 [Oligoflexia bacterium]|nr:hypothetical protein [Oligoflexia bacterium]
MKWNGSSYNSIPRIFINDEIEILHLPELNQGNFEEIYQALKNDLENLGMPQSYEGFKKILNNNYPSHISYFIDLHFKTKNFDKNRFPIERCHQLVIVNNLLTTEILGSVIKLKLGRLEFENELEILEQFTNTNKNVSLRIDTNSSYDRHQYKILIERYSENIEYIELDENELDYDLPVKRAWDYNLNYEIPDVDIIVLKPSLIGDIEAIRNFIESCEKEIVFSSTFEAEVYQQYILENLASHETVHGLLSYQYRG